MHLGVGHAISTFLLVILVGTLWRLAAIKLKDGPVGQAMAFMY